MIQENIILTLRRYHLILSSFTHKPYLDKDFCCYMIEDPSEAKAFTEKTVDTYYDEQAYYKQINFCTEFYSYGISAIKVKTRQQTEYTTIPVERLDAKKQYYNPEANRLILRLLETKQKQYLRDMKSVVFLSPVVLDPRHERQYPGIHYSYATTNQTDKYYLLFSTMQEFDTWNAEQEKKCVPLEVDLDTFTRIRHQDPVIINPASDKLILNDKQIKLIYQNKE